MSAVRWTPEQKQAIETRGRDLLVAAGAGAGKTAVLVERVMRLITDPEHPVDINRILVVTFTNAAAEEMRVRIRGALHTALRENPGSPLLNRQTALLEQAAITTMHSFCLDTVRRYFDLVDLDPAFRVGDEHELALLRLDVMAELFENRYGDPAHADRFAHLVDIYGGERGDLALQDLVLRLYDFVRSTPRPQRWFTRALALWEAGDAGTPDDLPWGRDLRRIVGTELEHAWALAGEAVRAAREPEGPTPYLKVLVPELEFADRLVRAGREGWPELARAFAGRVIEHLPPSRGGDEALREEAKEWRKRAREVLDGLESTFLGRTPDQWRREMQAVRPVLRDLAALTTAFEEAYTAAKRDRGLVDFSDLEHLCLRILSAEAGEDLVPSAVARELCAWYREIMVDEYQDINGLQEAILTLISGREGENHRFLVGDMKQSIYRFRLAEPDLFLHKYRTYPALAGASGGAARLDLSRNFRSRRVIIGAVNDIFGRIMSTATGEMDYDERARLYYGAGYPPDPEAGPAGTEQVELHIIDRTAAPAAATRGPAEEPGEETDEAYETAEAEALLAAARIKRLVGEDSGAGPARVYDRRQGRYRAVTYRDIVILLRSPKGWANTFVEVFHRAGIPVFADLGTGYFAATEVEAMLSLLTVIDNPRQDIPLAGVLRSPFGGFDARDLAEIRIARPNGDFYACVAAAAAGEDRLARRLRDFLARLERWRTLARRQPLPELIWQLYRDTGYYEFVGGLPGGAQRQANLRALHSRARQYECTSYRGLFRFLRFIERVREKGEDLGTARPLGENEDVVRVMSIHRSKGLEFPVVILAGLGKQFNLRDCYEELLLHKDLGLAAGVIDPVLRLRYPTLFQHLVRTRLRGELLAEEMRVLYVALTRAREHLILIGTGAPDKLFGYAAGGAAVLDRYHILKARSFLAWIGIALAGHPAAAARARPAETPAPVPPDVAARWAVRFTDATALTGAAPAPAAPAADPEVVARLRAAQPVTLPPAEDDRDEVRQRLEWVYPRSAETVRPVKLTATQLRRGTTPGVGDDAAPLTRYRPPLVRQPRCLLETVPLTAAEYGTAVHLVMQHIDWAATSPEAVREEVARLAAAGLVSAAQAAAIDPPVIARFLQSALAARVRRGIAFQREVPFTLRLPAGEFYPDVHVDEYVLVQGVIDGLLTETDGFVLLDYKTDRVPPGEIRAVAERYRGQLDLYARAVQSITGGKVKERYVYLFDAATAVQL